MKQRNKYKTGVYAFLDKQGVLQTGDESIIKDAKRKYWLEYKRRWNKENRSDGRSFSIYFNQKELKYILNAAENNSTKPTNFIKQLSLASAMSQNFITPAKVGEIRELLMLNYNTLQAFAEEEKLPGHLDQQLLKIMVNLETDILNVLGKNKQVNNSTNKF